MCQYKMWKFNTWKIPTTCHTRYGISRELATTLLIFETRRNINETRDRRSNAREKGPVVVHHRRVVPFDLSFLFFALSLSLSRRFFSSQAFRPRSVRDRRPHRASSRTGNNPRRGWIRFYRGPGLKPRVSPIRVRRRRVFTVHNSAECISNACQCQDRNADVVRRFAPFRTRGPPRRGRGPSGARRSAAAGNPEHYVASLRSAERFKVVICDAKTRHPRLPGYLCTLHRPDG